MRHIILAAALLSATAVHAADNDESPDAICGAWGRLAGKIMEMRQLEIPMSEALALSGNGAEGTVARQLVMKAYDLPAYDTPSNQQRSIDSFRNQIELQCFKEKT
nr:hypothetical protein [Brucella canis]